MMELDLSLILDMMLSLTLAQTLLLRAMITSLRVLEQETTLVLTLFVEKQWLVLYNKQVETEAQ
jgi:hypothetical protein